MDGSPHIAVSFDIFSCIVCTYPIVRRSAAFVHFFILFFIRFDRCNIIVPSCCSLFPFLFLVPITYTHLRRHSNFPFSLLSCCVPRSDRRVTTSTALFPHRHRRKSTFSWPFLSRTYRVGFSWRLRQLEHHYYPLAVLSHIRFFEAR